MLPPFHGEALKRWAGTIAAIAHEELDTWVPGKPLKALPRMQAVTLEVIQRVIFGSRDPELRDAVRAALDLTASTLAARDDVAHRAVPERSSPPCSASTR